MRPQELWNWSVADILNFRKTLKKTKAYICSMGNVNDIQATLLQDCDERLQMALQQRYYNVEIWHCHIGLGP